MPVVTCSDSSTGLSIRWASSLNRGLTFISRDAPIRDFFPFYPIPGFAKQALWWNRTSLYRANSSRCSQRLRPSSCTPARTFGPRCLSDTPSRGLPLRFPHPSPPEKQAGKAPPSYGSIYPCVQNILLACRALGLGASLTTIHHM